MIDVCVQLPVQTSRVRDFLSRPAYVRLWKLGLPAFTVSVVVLGLVSTYVLATKPTANWPVQWHGRLEAHFVSIYVVAAVSLLAVSTMVPTFGFFKLAHGAVSELATKHEQVTLLKERLTPTPASATSLFARGQTNSSRRCRDSHWIVTTRSRLERSSTIPARPAN